MRILLTMLVCIIAVTCGVVFCEGTVKTMFQYAFFGTLVVSGLLLANGVGD